MENGRSHKWHYDRGDWKETKITPDLWQIGYAVTTRSRRAIRRLKSNVTRAARG